MSTETLLREALAARADEVAPSSEDAYARVSGAIRTARRRRRAAGAGAVALVAAVTVAVPTLGRSATDRHATPATRSATLQLPAPSDPAWLSAKSWSARGSLAGDHDLVAAASKRLDGAHVVFAGDVQDTRLVLATAWDGETWKARMLSGPSGTPVDALGMRPENDLVDHGTMVVRRDVGPDGWLLVLTARGVRSAELSTGVRVTTAGGVTRKWSSLPLSDGVGVARLENAPAAVTRVRAGAYDGNDWLPARDEDAQRESTPFCGACGDHFFTTGVDAVRDEVADILGLAREDVKVTSRIEGFLDPSMHAGAGSYGGPGSTSRVLVVTAELPGGAVVRTVAVGSETPGGGGELTLPEEVVPLEAATAAHRPWVAWVGDAKGGTTVQVFAPGAASARLTSDAPSIVPDTGRRAVVDGSALFRLDETGLMEHRRVVTYDAAGHELGRWPLQPPTLDDPLDVRGDS